MFFMRRIAVRLVLAGVGFAGAIGVACGGGSSGASPADASSPAEDEGVDASCAGVDAVAATVGFPAKCEECIAASCCGPFQTCFADPNCTTVEICTGDCIEKQGMSPLTCATKCAADTDSGTVQTEADDLNTCIVTKCPTPCNP
jgi:hypothetical protein